MKVMAVLSGVLMGAMSLYAVEAVSVDSQPRVLSATWSRYYTDLKQPPGQGGREWGGFGVCHLTLDQPGEVSMTWTDTEGKKHERSYHFKTTEGTIIMANSFWEKGDGLPPFMLRAEFQNEEE